MTSRQTPRMTTLANRSRKGIDAETMFLFQHEDIDSVHFLGYINAEVQSYQASVREELEKNAEKADS